VKTVLKAIGLLLGLAVALFFIVANFSIAASTRYECKGTIISNESRQPATVYFRLEEYRWWVHLWSDSDGNFWLELPGTGVDYYSGVERLGEDLIKIQRSPTELSGSFSRLSQRLSIQTSLGAFEGTCTKGA
jgi:hypothetical protein